MKKTILALLFIGNCVALNAQQSSDQNVPYKIANRYFSKHETPNNEFQVLKITNAEDFEKYFGMAATMGKDGMPTKINFSNSYVIALIAPADNTTEKIIIYEVLKNNGQINVTYKIQDRPTPSSAQYKMCELLIVDKKEKGFVVANRIGMNNEPVMGGDLDENGCKPSAGMTWSVLENNCIRPYTTNYVLEGEGINAIGTAAMIMNADGTTVEIIGAQQGRNIMLTKKPSELIWTNGKMKLTSIGKEEFMLTENNKPIAKAKLRN